MRTGYGPAAPRKRRFPQKIEFFHLFLSLKPLQTVLTIAGFDPSSGAGVTADLMVFAAHSLFGTACITALTVQSTLGVQASHPIAASIVGATLDCLNADLPPCGVKIGVTATSDTIIIISEFVTILRASHSDYSETRLPIVLDPVVRSSSGRELLDEAGVQALRGNLLPLVDWVTPNLEELAILSGEPVSGREDIPKACRALQAKAARKEGSRLGVIATGGHMDPPDDFVLTPVGETAWLPGERVVTRSTHGTGCAFSSAFLSRLVLGESAMEAARGAKQYVSEAMKRAENYGHGISGINQLWTKYQP
jgi:hydroxymethylpyrimidine/phosphomethylpyrimidine kinase